MKLLTFLGALALGLSACGDDDATDAGRDARSPFDDAGNFSCVEENSAACVDDQFLHCQRDGEFFSVVTDDCPADNKVCSDALGCVVCRPNEFGCDGNNAVQCDEEGTDYDVVDECEIEVGEVCADGQCKNLCDVALENRSYQGCEFYAVDLDNASLGAGRDASGQQFSVVVSNPGLIASHVMVEVNRAPVGDPPVIEVIDEVDVLPGDLEVFSLPRREVDGSSSNAVCAPDDRDCEGDEVCVCSRGDREDPCFCRVAADADGLNDGTHSAVTSHAFRLRSSLPIVAYQFNPLDNVGVFSNDSSVILPTSGLGERYTVVGWPQTIADSDDPDMDFDSGEKDEDLRAFLTIIGTEQGTHVSISLGRRATRVVAVGGGGLTDLDEDLEFDIGPFDVINLETQGLNQDFTGTEIEASNNVSVFVGSEASDAPRFDDYSMRQCCADHLEEQLFPDSSLGRTFSIGRSFPRSKALNHAFVDPTRDSVGEVNEPEWVRVLAVSDDTRITTTLPGPNDQFTLDAGEDRILRADQDFLMNASEAVAVLQIQPSQDAVGIDTEYPGGDPSIIVVPPIEQWRRDYVFLTPSNYAFDFVTIMADAATQIVMDGKPISDFDCDIGPADGKERRPGDPAPTQVVYRCQLSFPDVIGLPNVRVEDGIQNDGVHTLVATRPVGLIVAGFDAYVSHAYAGGSNLTILN